MDECRWALPIVVSFAVLILLIGCGMDTPLTPENMTPASWPESITGTPFASAATPDLLTGIQPATGATGPTETRVPRGAQLTLPACTPPIEKPASFPTNFAPGFPFPPGLQLFISRTLENDPNQIQVVGYAPLSLNSSVRYMLEELPRSGYALGRGDSEAGEAEATFSGNGWRGGFRVSETRCPDVTEWVIVVAKR